MTDSSSCSLPDNTVYTGYLTANSSSEKTLLHYQPPKQVKTEYVPWKIQSSRSLRSFQCNTSKDSGTEFLMQFIYMLKENKHVKEMQFHLGMKLVFCLGLRTVPLIDWTLNTIWQPEDHFSVYT